MALDEPQGDDIVETVNGIQVAIDKRVEEHVKTLALDIQGSNLVMTGIDSCC
ncbi:hypothetical protein [Ammoniphilus sp. YIM 78166]|uniref:hypothetical protein n=1 Tax=Ammoniphilus sp. YIM 78166 TaxID=1644106 RepID=UPI001F0D8917|nr:hypothetical protein [Ammoniphilus sp. YIM 78166]